MNNYQVKARFTRLAKIHSVQLYENNKNIFALEIEGFLEKHNYSYTLVMDHHLKETKNFSFLEGKKMYGTLTLGDTTLKINPKNVNYKFSLNSMVFTIRPPSHLTNQNFKMQMNFTEGVPWTVAINHYCKPDGKGGCTSVCTNGQTSATCAQQPNHTWIEKTCECLDNKEIGNNKEVLGCENKDDCKKWQQIYGEKNIYAVNDRLTCCKKQFIEGFKNNCRNRLTCITESIIDIGRSDPQHNSNFINALDLTFTYALPFVDGVNSLLDGYEGISKIIESNISKLSSGSVSNADAVEISKNLSNAQADLTKYKAEREALQNLVCEAVPASIPTPQRLRRGKVSRRSPAVTAKPFSAPVPCAQTPQGQATLTVVEGEEGKTQEQLDAAQEELKKLIFGGEKTYAELTDQQKTMIGIYNRLGIGPEIPTTKTFTVFEQAELDKLYSSWTGDLLALSRLAFEDELKNALKLSNGNIEVALDKLIFTILKDPNVSQVQYLNVNSLKEYLNLLNELTIISGEPAFFTDVDEFINSSLEATSKAFGDFVKYNYNVDIPTDPSNPLLIKSYFDYKGYIESRNSFYPDVNIDQIYKSFLDQNGGNTQGAFVSTVKQAYKQTLNPDSPKDINLILKWAQFYEDIQLLSGNPSVKTDKQSLNDFLNVILGIK